jgi:fumarylacetoacetate (FAA) hydrolase
MQLVSYLRDGSDQLALLVNNNIYDTNTVHPQLSGNMNMFLQNWAHDYPLALSVVGALQQNPGLHISKALSDVQLLAPVPHPSSCRDAYAFRQHVETARRNRGLDMTPVFDEIPVFYFTNHRSITGPGDVACMPAHFDKLDFELEVAIVICKAGRNIKAADADAYIGGLMIMNDLSARALQMQEMQLSLGPAKGKDFATAIGPVLITLDELEQFTVPAPQGHTGKCWQLAMECSVNGVTVSKGSLSDMHWTFAEIIERCSYGVQLYPGDVIGSGTVGTGCFLELNGTGKRNDPAYTEQWLQAGDIVEIKVTGLGTLTNRIVAEETSL